MPAPAAPQLHIGTTTGNAVPAPPDPRRTALTLISAGMLGLAIVLGLWQQVDRACVDGAPDVGGALAACEAVPLAEDDPLPGAPANGELDRVTAAD